jgi:hypothetical protein
MSWRKLGHVYVAAGERPWRASHAFCPTVMELGERLRVLCAFLDREKVGRLGFVDVDAADPRRVLAVSEQPALDAGAPGTFDDNGVTPLSVVRLADGRWRLYYAGWQLGVQVRYYLFTGAAESEDEGRTFRRVSRVPVLDRSDGELMVRTGGFVRHGPEGFRMWYAGGSQWVAGPDGVRRPEYALRHVRSADGLAWPASGDVCLAPRGDEHGFGRPAVLYEQGEWRMWVSVRYLSRGYRIGYATSADGLAWRRHGEPAGLDVSDDGWDSEMVCMPCIRDTPAGRVMFYNGNNYGETGFGVALAEA